MDTHEEAYARRVCADAAMELGVPMRVWSVTGGWRDGLVDGGGAEPGSEAPGDALRLLAQRGQRAVYAMLDLGAHLEDERVLRALRDAIERLETCEGHLVLIEHDGGRLPAVIRAGAEDFGLSLPEDEELERIVRATLRRLHRERPVEIEISRGAFDAVLRNLRGLTRSQVERVVVEVVADDRRFDEEDLPRVISRKRAAIRMDGLLEFVEAPTSMDEIGGLGALKAWLKKRERSLSDEARRLGIDPPRGVLLLGVQGAGKSLCAKAVATAWARPLLRMDTGALYDRFVGESERRLREALRTAERMAPVILWIDEIEKAFASAASRSTDGGLSQRMFGTLLTWMQEHREAVFLVATANDIEALPPELLRKGRFDEIFFVDLPGAEAREAIFAVHLRKRGRTPEKFDLKALAAASAGYSGAEIEQAIIGALHGCLADGAELDTARVEASLRGSPPLSVTMGEKIEALREWASGRCVMAE
jgi:chloramphenicol 3-O-phosphotransferase